MVGPHVILMVYVGKKITSRLIFKEVINRLVIACLIKRLITSINTQKEKKYEDAI